MNKCESCYNMECVFVDNQIPFLDSENCQNYRGLTNADRIRAMSDEELAKWFCVMNADDCPDKAHELHCTDKCYECWLDWLKSPVEEVDNG